MEFSRRTNLCVFILLLFSTDSSSGLRSAAKIQVGGTTCNNCLVDQFGRFRVFHGLNRVEKQFPWYPPTLLNQTHIKLLSEWGFNAVRLGTMWSGVETSPCHVNETYLKVLDQIIGSLYLRGMSVILDMHQDVLSSKFSSYDGAPLWLLDTFKPPPPMFKYPFPFSKPPGSWFESYLTYACGDAFEQLYQNTSGAVQHLEFFWKTVAEKFGDHENVLGYELINEPWPGNVFKNPELFLPGYAGRTNLMPLYDKLAQAIRKVDSESLIFYEPVTWGMVLDGNLTGTGFDHVPGGIKTRSVLAFHYYCWVAEGESPAPFPKWKRVLCDSLLLPEVISSVTKHVEQIGGGMFLTEFGECQASHFHNTTEYIECLNVVNQADANFISWTYWDSNFFTADGNINYDNVKLFSRTYATAIAGHPINSSFNQTTAEYSLSYKPLILEAPTLIFVSPIHYPNGFTVFVSGGLKYSIADSSVEVVATKENLPISSILIKRK